MPRAFGNTVDVSRRRDELRADLRHNPRGGTTSRKGAWPPAG